MRRLRSVLVTGGAGFIGSHVVHRLLDRFDDVHVVTLDALTYAGSLDNLADLPDPDRHVLEVGDVRDEGVVHELIGDHAVDTVIHCAAESHVDRSIAGPLVFLETNVVGTGAALQGARAAWEAMGTLASARFHHVSTDEVYGDLDPEAAPAAEGDPVRPSSPYSASKAGSDHLVAAWHRTYGVPTSITWGSNTYGPRQYPEKLIPVVIRKALEGQPIPVYGDGLQVRDWLHVRDHVDGILAAATRGGAGGGWNLGSGTGTTNRDLIAAVCAHLDTLVPAGAPHARHVGRVDDRPGHDRRYALANDRAAAEIGWTPQVALDDGLAETVAWYARQLGVGDAA